MKIILTGYSWSSPKNTNPSQARAIFFSGNTSEPVSTCIIMHGRYSIQSSVIKAMAPSWWACLTSRWSDDIRMTWRTLQQWHHKKRSAYTGWVVTPSWYPSSKSPSWHPSSESGPSICQQWMVQRRRAKHSSKSYKRCYDILTDTQKVDMYVSQVGMKWWNDVITEMNWTLILFYFVWLVPHLRF